LKNLIMDSKRFKTVNEYLRALSSNSRNKLKQIRELVKKEVPKADELISYNMPAFKLNGKILVYYAAFKNHIGFFPTSTPIAALKKELIGYKTSKGTIQFPLDKPLPIELIKKIVKYKEKEIIK